MATYIKLFYENGDKDIYRCSSSTCKVVLSELYKGPDGGLGLVGIDVPFWDISRRFTHNGVTKQIPSGRLVTGLRWVNEFRTRWNVRSIFEPRMCETPYEVYCEFEKQCERFQVPNLSRVVVERRDKSGVHIIADFKPDNDHYGFSTETGQFEVSNRRYEEKSDAN